MNFTKRKDTKPLHIFSGKNFRNITLESKKKKCPRRDSNPSPRMFSPKTSENGVFRYENPR